MRHIAIDFSADSRYHFPRNGDERFVTPPSPLASPHLNPMAEEKIKVLVADDEDPLRVTVTAWLSDEGFDVDQAPAGLEAIKKVQSQDFDIAILDIKMPGANGLEVLRYIKKNSDRKSV